MSADIYYSNDSYVLVNGSAEDDQIENYGAAVTIDAGIGMILFATTATA